MGQGPIDERTGGMRCFECGSYRLSVVDSRPIFYMGQDVVRRSRKCGDCNSRYFTIEIPETKMEAVVEKTKSHAISMIRRSILSYLEDL